MPLQSNNNFSIVHIDESLNNIETVVAMAVYCDDNPDWLKQAINSILEQSYSDFTFFIVIDGKVSSEIQAVIRFYSDSDKRIVVGQNETNMGLASAMNSIIEWAIPYSPTFFVRMDADDISATHRLERQISYLKKHAYISVLGSALTEVNEDGVKVGARAMPSSHKQIVELLPRRCSMNHPTVTIRFDVFERGFRYNGDLRNTQDYFFWIALAKDGFVFRNLKDRLLKFRRVNNFYKRRGLSKSINEFKARFTAMYSFKKLTMYNIFYACSVLALRLMPSKIVKLAYKADRKLLDRFGKH